MKDEPIAKEFHYNNYAFETKQEERRSNFINHNKGIEWQVSKNVKQHGNS